MTNPSQSASISLSFNGSWIAFMGSSVYRVAIQAIEMLGKVFSYPLVAPYSGRRLYQLVDAFCYSAKKTHSYNQARLEYADELIKALEGEKNIFEKTKRVRTILNTNILGLSLLQKKEKQWLSEHIGFTVLASLIRGFGEEMASKAIEALQELDSEEEKDFNQFARLYKDLTLQHTDIDSFVKILQELNSHVPREILIHELILSRNNQLPHPAKVKIASTLQDSHYIEVRLQRKIELKKRLGEKIDEKELTGELKSQRKTQLETLNYTNPSMFTPKEHAVGTFEVDEEDTESIEDFQDAIGSPDSSANSHQAQASESPTGESIPAAENCATVSNTNAPLSESPTAESIPETPITVSDANASSKDLPTRVETVAEDTATISLKTFKSPEMPVRIVNHNNSCWYNAALQLLYNTSLFYEIGRQRDRFSAHFPQIAQSFASYGDYYWEQSDIRRLENPSSYGTSEALQKEIEEYFEKDPTLREKVRTYRKNRQFPPLDLGEEMNKIRSEIHHKVNKEFKDSGATQEDSRQFLLSLLNKLSIDVAETAMNAEDFHDLANSKYVFFHKSAGEAVDVEKLLLTENHILEGALLHSGTNNAGHYYAVVRRHQKWYLCNDSSIQLISKEQLQAELQKNSACIMVSKMNGSEDTETLRASQSLRQRLLSFFTRQ